MGASQIAMAADLELMPAEPLVLAWQPWLELGGRASTDLSGGHATLFVPWTLGPESLVFLELRGKLLERDVREGNVALGYRHMMANGWNLGLWGGYDIRHTRHGNTYDQVSAGIELLHPNWDVRLNGHLALDEGDLVGGTGQVVLQDTSIFMLTREELPLSGIDGEIGWRVPLGGLASLESPHELRIYGGGYHFDRGSADQAATGPKGRLEWRINDVIPQMPGSRLTFEAGISHDKVRDTVGFAGVNFRIPFGNPATPLMAHNPQSRRMIEPLVREDVFVASSSLREGVEDALTDVPFDRVAYVGDGGSVTDTSAAAGDNTLIIAEGGTISGPQQLQGNQTLQGGASTIDVRGQTSGVVSPFTAPGTQPTLAAPGDAPNLTLLGSNTHVAGLAIEGAGQFSGFGSNHGILIGPDQQNVFIGLSEIFDVGHEGIHILSRNEVTIYSTDIRNTGDDGIDIDGDDNVVSLDNVTIADAADDGLDIDGSDNVVSLNNSAITGSGDDGINLGDANAGSNTVKILNSLIANTGDDGVNIEDDSHFNTLEIVGSTIRDTGEDAIDIDSDNNTVIVRNSAFVNMADDGIDSTGGEDNNVTVADTTISNTGADGITVGDFNTYDIARTSITDIGGIGIRIGGSSNVTITGVTLDMIGDEGIDLTSGNSVVDITDTTVTNVTGDDGLDLNGSGNVVTVENTTFGNIASNGIEIDNNNTVTLDISALTGNFGEHGIFFDGANNTLDGAGNTAAGATFGGQFCETGLFAQNGFFDFIDDGTGNPGTCP